MPTKHAVLSASSSARWLACPPSALLNARQEDTPTEYAAQGTDAHSLCEYRARKILDQEAADPTGRLAYYDEEMSECADEYSIYVLEQYEEAKKSCKDPLVLLEQQLDFGEWVPEGFGTGDCILVAEPKLTIIDFKYGLGVLVDAEWNTQMMCYALGALTAFDGIYDIDTIDMTIFQPRRDNISTFTLTKAKLLQWAEEVLKPRAALAAKGEGEFTAGEHCRFCKVRATCRKRAEYNLEMACYDFAPPPNLADTEIEIVLGRADELVAWANDVKEYALQQAVSGKTWKGWKLVEGRSNRRYVNEDAVADIVKKAGYDPYDHKVMGITAMTKLLGRKQFDELLEGLIEKPQGKPVLVPETDKRPSMNTAVNDFKEEN